MLLQCSHISEYNEGGNTPQNTIFLSVRNSKHLSCHVKTAESWHPKQGSNQSPCPACDRECSRWEQNFPHLPFSVSVTCSVTSVQFSSGDPWWMALQACIHFTQKCSLSHCHCHRTLFRMEFSDISCCRVVWLISGLWARVVFAFLSETQYLYLSYRKPKPWSCRPDWVWQPGVLVPPMESRNNLDIMLEIRRLLGCELFPDIYAFLVKIMGFLWGCLKGTSHTSLLANMGLEIKNLYASLSR